MDFIPGGPARFEHQRRGLRKMIATGGVAALLFDPGTGKTATALDYCSLLALKAPSGEARVLVVCPLAAVDTWIMQAEQFVSPQVNFWAEALGGSILRRGEAMASRGGNPMAGTYPPARGTAHHPRAVHHRLAVARSMRSDRAVRPTPSEGPDGLGDGLPRLVIEVVNIDTFSSRLQHKSRTMADFMLDAVRRYRPDLVIVDESHKIKSAGGNASRLLGRISDIAPRRVLLTGTVMPHGPLDVFGQWRFLDPYAFGIPAADGSLRRATIGSFRSRYAVMGGFMGREVVGFRNLDDMQTIMSRNAIVARKEDALDLPRTMDVVVPVELSPAEKQVYNDLKNDLSAQLGASQVTVPNRLTQMLRLRQVTSGYVPADSGGLSVVGTSKVRTIASIVHDTLAGESRIVVFCYFTHEIDTLASALAKRGTEVQVVKGETPTEERILLRKRFGSSDPARMVMVAQIRTMSLAVNELVTASHCVFGSLSQQRDDIVQARDRLNRIGQTRPVTFWYAVARGTVDTVILKSHRDRTDLENAMLKHIAGEGEGE